MVDVVGLAEDWQPAGVGVWINAGVEYGIHWNRDVQLIVVKIEKSEVEGEVEVEVVIVYIVARFGNLAVNICTLEAGIIERLGMIQLVL